MFAIVLAAGEGTRMHSSRPKPLHRLCGRPMVRYVLDALVEVEPVVTVVVVGHEATWVEKEIGEHAGRSHLLFAHQEEQLGTGHAVGVALAALGDRATGDGDIVIVPGDAPLVRAATVRDLVSRHRDAQAALTVLSARVADPSGYGRVVRGRDGAPVRIVEERDAEPHERAIDEVNTSLMVVRTDLLGPALRRVGRRNAQHQYYLSDLVEVLHDAGHVTRAVVLEDPHEASGVNDRRQLAGAEVELRRRINERWMARGVTMWDPAHTYVDADVELAPDVSLLPGTMLRGRCVVGRGATVGPEAHLRNVVVGENARVANVVATDARVGAGAPVGPFAVLEPGAVVAASQVVGAFEHHLG